MALGHDEHEQQHSDQRADRVAQVLQNASAAHAAEDGHFEQDVVQPEQVRPEAMSVGEAIDEHMARSTYEGGQRGHQEPRPTVAQHAIALGLQWTKIRQRTEESVRGEAPKQYRVDDGERHGDQHPDRIMRLKEIQRRQRVEEVRAARADYESDPIEPAWLPDFERENNCLVGRESKWHVERMPNPAERTTKDGRRSPVTAVTLSQPAGTVPTRLCGTAIGSSSPLDSSHKN